MNFKVNLKEGYEVASIIATPGNNYKNLKLPAELGEFIYRITKVTGEEVFSFTAKTYTYSRIIIASEDLKQGVTYNLYRGTTLVRTWTQN